MRGCEDYRTNIQLYFDKELRDQDLEDFHAHLEECEACRTALETMEELSGLLHRSQFLFSAPDALRKQVFRALYANADHPADGAGGTIVYRILLKLLSGD